MTATGAYVVSRGEALARAMTTHKQQILDVLSMREEDQPTALNILLRAMFNDGYDQGSYDGFAEGRAVELWND